MKTGLEAVVSFQDLSTSTAASLANVENHRFRTGQCHRPLANQVKQLQHRMCIVTCWGGGGGVLV